MNLDALNIRRKSDLDRLPWFHKDDEGEISLARDTGLPPILDVHSHLGWSYGFSRPIDMTARPDLIYYFDYDSDQELLREEIHPTDAERRAITKEWMGTFFVRTRMSRTQTAANFATEMDRFNYEAACLLPIEVPFHTRNAAETLAASRLDNRFIPFAAVAPWPWSAKKEALLEKQFEAGARALKFHPEFQYVAPDSKHAMKLFEWCAAHDVVVLSHCGYGGSEPASMKRKAEPERFRAMLEAFPNLRLVLGHTGLSRYKDMLAFARQFDDHVWLDVSGQPTGPIREIVDGYDRQKLMYGSDWPFYPLCVAIARVLVATEDLPQFWVDLFHDNAARLLGMPLAGRA
jgi:predicted TIM-barrel fold metal-dependent hydrolase